MNVRLLKSKIHRATVTEADLTYEGSITIDRELCANAGFHEFEEVDVYNINNGSRFTTYVLFGKKGEICVNGAAARLVQRGDLVIICAFCSVEEKLATAHTPKVILVNSDNSTKEIISHTVRRG